VTKVQKNIKKAMQNVQKSIIHGNKIPFFQNKGTLMFV